MATPTYLSSGITEYAYDAYEHTVHASATYALLLIAESTDTDDVTAATLNSDAMTKKTGGVTGGTYTSWFNFERINPDTGLLPYVLTGESGSFNSFIFSLSGVDSGATQRSTGRWTGPQGGETSASVTLTTTTDDLCCAVFRIPAALAGEVTPMTGCTIRTTVNGDNVFYAVTRPGQASSTVIGVQWTTATYAQNHGFAVAVTGVVAGSGDSGAYYRAGQLTATGD
jgi:hypothetical protein